MSEKIDKLIDLNLNHLNNNINRIWYNIHDLLDLNEKMNQNPYVLIDELELNELIEVGKDGTRTVNAFKLSPKAKGIINKGGWLIYKEQEARKEQEQIERDKNNNELVISNIKSNKFKKITTVLTLVIFFASFIWQILKAN